jgi:hypothetical protein
MVLQLGDNMATGLLPREVRLEASLSLGRSPIQQEANVAAHHRMVVGLCVNIAYLISRKGKAFGTLTCPPPPFPHQR